MGESLRGRRFHSKHENTLTIPPITFFQIKMCLLCVLPTPRLYYIYKMKAKKKSDFYMHLQNTKN